MLSSVEIKDGAASKRDVECEIASELERRKFQGVSQEAVTRSITAQLCAVNKAMMGVKKVMRAGSRVVFDEEGTCIGDFVTGKRILATDDGGMFMVKNWVNRKAGFQRQENKLGKAQDAQGR